MREIGFKQNLTKSSTASIIPCFDGYSGLKAACEWLNAAE
jgi:hypothetical protein